MFRSQNFTGRRTHTKYSKTERVTRMGRVLKTRYSDQLKELVMISLKDKTGVGEWWGAEKGVIQEQSISI